MGLGTARLLAQRLRELRGQVLRHLYNLIIRPPPTHVTTIVPPPFRHRERKSARRCGPQVLGRIRIIILIYYRGMKEETPNERHPDLPATYHAQAHPLQPAPTAPEPPSARFKHQAFLYRGRLYIHGGTTIPSSDFADDPLDLHCYHLEGEGAPRWERVRTRGPAGKEVECVSAHAGVVTGNKWYTFGGSNADCRPNSLLLRLNLDSLQWTRLEQKGEVPTARESAFLTFFEKNWLLLYGGISTTQVEIYNTFHFYNLDTRNWSSCEGPYLYQLYARLDPAISHFNDKLYLFGGTYRTINNEERYLHDFYQISVTPPGRNQAGRVQVKRLPQSNVNKGRSGHNLVPLGNHHLMLLGGENTISQLRDNLRFEDVSLVDDAWVFDTRSNSWGRVEMNAHNFRFRSMASCISYNSKLYLFGGLHNYNTVLKDLVVITVDQAELEDPKRIELDCPQCHQREKFPPSARYLPARVLQDVAEGIDFPFAAIGLLIDNSMNSGASLLKISYFLAFGTQRQRMLKFEDDAKLNWTDEELLQTLGNYNAGHLHAPSGTDKKIKAGMLKDAFRREYGYNLKVASLRLGEGFLFISYNDDHSLFRVCCFEKEAPDSPAPHYALHFYTYSIYERKVTSAHMEPVRQRIMARFGDMIEAVFFQRKCRNTLLILSPRVQDVKQAADAQEETELKADIDNSNILNGPINKIRQLERSGFFIQECVDVSLRAYITCLYLKNECMKIMLSVRQNAINPIEVPTQTFLEKVDRLCKHKHVLEINPALQFDLKISQLYYLYDLRRKLSFFNNGLLIYHKNRLLTRFKYPLGELILRKYYKRHNCHNFIRLFGFIELPDHIPINFLKTTYLHHAMMERLFSRLKLISKLFKRELSHLAADHDYRRPAPTKLNEEEAQQEKNQVSEPKPPRPRKVEQAPREISLRKKKNFQKSSLEGRLKQLLKDPTSGNIKEIIRLIEENSSNGKQKEFGTFYQQKRMIFGDNAPPGRPLSCKSLMMDKMKEQNAQKLQAEKGMDQKDQGEAMRALEAAQQMIEMEKQTIFLDGEKGNSAGNAPLQIFDSDESDGSQFEAEDRKQINEEEGKKMNAQRMLEQKQDNEGIEEQQKEDGAVPKQYAQANGVLKDDEKPMEEEKIEQQQAQPQMARQEIIQQPSSPSRNVQVADEQAAIHNHPGNDNASMERQAHQGGAPINNHSN